MAQLLKQARGLLKKIYSAGKIKPEITNIEEHCIGEQMRHMGQFTESAPRPIQSIRCDCLGVLCVMQSMHIFFVKVLLLPFTKYLGQNDR